MWETEHWVWAEDARTRRGHCEDHATFPEARTVSEGGWAGPCSGGLRTFLIRVILSAPHLSQDKAKLDCCFNDFG